MIDPINSNGIKIDTGDKNDKGFSISRAASNEDLDKAGLITFSIKKPGKKKDSDEIDKNLGYIWGKLFKQSFANLSDTQPVNLTLNYVKGLDTTISQLVILSDSFEASNWTTLEVPFNNGFAITPVHISKFLEIAQSILKIEEGTDSYLDYSTVVVRKGSSAFQKTKTIAEAWKDNIPVVLEMAEMMLGQKFTSLEELIKANHLTVYETSDLLMRK
jgi:hypothetical protein